MRAFLNYFDTHGFRDFRSLKRAYCGNFGFRLVGLCIPSLIICLEYRSYFVPLKKCTDTIGILDIITIFWLNYRYKLTLKLPNLTGQKRVRNIEERRKSI